MICYKKNENTEGERNLQSDDFDFDGIVIFENYERGESLKKKEHTVMSIAIFAIVRKSKV